MATETQSDQAGEKGANTEASPVEDRRLVFIADFVLKSLKVKQDKWQKCVSIEENHQVLQDFLDRAERRSLFVCLTAGGTLQSATCLSSSSPGTKAVYFMKRENTALTVETMREKLNCGHMPSNPLDLLSAIDKLLDMLVSNSSNHTEWPPGVCDDVVQNVHSLKNDVFVVSGQVQGKTLLPLPMDFERVEQAALEMGKRGGMVERCIIHSLESAVIEWSRQISAVLKIDSSGDLLEGKNPTPDTELLFWKNRYADLDGIHSQLTSSKVNKMGKLLEAAESSYFPAFTNMQQNVSAALEEAKDISIYLMPLKGLFEDMESMEFPEVRRQIGPLMHTVCLVWANSRHYNTPQRLILLLQETCNLLIQQAQAFLVPDEILKGEVSESLLTVETCLEILQLFRTTYEDRRVNLTEYQRARKLVKPWDFSPLLVFSRFDCFIDRIQAIKDILLTALDMLKLEKLVIGAVRGSALSEQVQLLHQDFADTFKFITEKPYDCLDLNNTEFEGDVRKFNLRVDDIERRLGTIFCLAFDDACGLQPTFKVVDMFGSLLERPLVAADAVSRYPLLVTVFEKELNSCKLIYDKHIQLTEELGSPVVSKNMPPVAGGLRWAQSLQNRIQTQFSKFRHLSCP
ncbi:dynein heavy chain 9, axonemal [Hippoglossus hippoglossus]|uniref:dynein heavy chain 9, axonemal n=1 Tax=Hippoglossus hippoglossus TaxID=8267 RepID=UPI00148D60AF|nr:dynein heavy chain 9, axonemal [Hippoglossus hippoglossus]